MKSNDNDDTLVPGAEAEKQKPTTEENAAETGAQLKDSKERPGKTFKEIENNESNKQNESNENDKSKKKANSDDKDQK